jgi:hypothetical protein
MDCIGHNGYIVLLLALVDSYGHCSLNRFLILFLDNLALAINHRTQSKGNLAYCKSKDNILDFQMLGIFL